MCRLLEEYAAPLPISPFLPLRLRTALPWTPRYEIGYDSARIRRDQVYAGYAQETVMSFDAPLFFARLRQPEESPGWSAALAVALVAAYLAARVAALAIFSVLLDVDSAARGVFSPLAVNLAGTVAALTALALIAMVVRRRGQQSLTAALRLERWPGSTLLLMIFALGMAILIDFIPLIFQTIGLPATLQGLWTGGLVDWLAAALYVVVAAPLAEMALLAGMLYPALAARRNPFLAITLTALLYAAVQAFDNPADPVVWIESLLAGVFLITLRAHQRSTRPTVIAAAMFGLFALFKALRLFL